MTKFLEENLEEQETAYTSFATNLGLIPLILEKDAWVCWALDALFTIGDGVQMAFKGGTSLSKVYNAISRFSEDIDVTIAYESLDSAINPFDQTLSSKERKRQASAMIDRYRQYVREVIEPHFKKLLTSQFPGRDWKLEILEDGEILNFYYPAAVKVGGELGYVDQVVKLEFGGRNATTPTETHRVIPYIQAMVGESEMPAAEVAVLSPERTFWEKATLAHVECNRVGLKEDRNRLSRHWYDLYKLADHEIGRRALKNKDLLTDVVRFKKVFFHTGYANYDECLTGGLKLVPPDETIEALKLDYENMIEQGMFQDDPPTFDDIIARLRALEAEINA